MKKFNLQVLFILFSISVNAQTFTLQDSAYSVGDVLRPDNIMFNLGKATIRAESHPFLDSLTNFLNQNKTLKIEIGNHCDERYSNNVSQCLTCERAKSIGNYLISKGVVSQRLILKGYNDTKPIIRNAKTEAEHSQNRRTEIKIIATDFKE